MEKMILPVGVLSPKVRYLREHDDSVELFHVCSRKTSPKDEQSEVVSYAKVQFDWLQGNYYCSGCKAKAPFKEVSEDGKGTGYEGHC